jgi:hypothetical protein
VYLRLRRKRRHLVLRAEIQPAGSNHLAVGSYPPDRDVGRILREVVAMDQPLRNGR